MTKKSLFFGTAARSIALAIASLLVLFAFVGCSNPSSGTTEYVAQLVDEYDYPEDTVFTNDFAELEGLLYNVPSVETNAVTHVAYDNDSSIAKDLTIPKDKTVYLNGGNLNLNATGFQHTIIVEAGARLVLVGIELSTADSGRLLVKGTVEIYGGGTLKVTPGVHPAMQVADYYVINDTISARDTVIGTSRVVVAPGGTLILTADDIANQYTDNRFTPAQAWAAAGQGHLEIDYDPAPANLLPALPAFFTVTYLVNQIGTPPAGRTYTVVTDGGGGGDDGVTVPSVIPAGAHITAFGAITDAVGHTLTINGWLTANNATFEKVESLTISSSDTDTLVSRSAGPPVFLDLSRGYLAADSATLKAAKTITIGNRGEFETESSAIDLPEDARIILGRSALFIASDTTTANSFDNLAGLWIGPASDVTINSRAVTFKSLKTLTLQDGAAISVPNGVVTYLVEANPATPPKKTEITLGLNALISVATAPGAKVDLAITSDSSLRNGSEIAVNNGSTFTVAAGKTLTVEDSATVDFRGITTEPTGTDPAPIIIEGTIEVKEGGILRGVDPSGFSTPGDASTVVKYKDNGKIVLNFEDDTSTTKAYIGNLEYVGSTSSFYRPGVDGAVVELKEHHMKLVSGDVTVPTSSYAVIMAHDTLELAADTTLTLGNGASLALMGGTDADGATLKGLGKLIAGGIEFIGGDGWRGYGVDRLGIRAGTNTAILEKNTVATGTPAANLIALGSGAKIIVGGTNTLSLGDDTVINLKGTSARKDGEIVLDNGGTIAFAADTDTKIVTGAGTPTNTTGVPLAAATAASSSAITAIAVNGLPATTNSLTFTTGVLVTTPAVSVGAGRLVSLADDGTAISIAASADVSISSETITNPSP